MPYVVRQRKLKKQYDDLVAILAPGMPPFSDAVDAKEGDVDGIKYR